MGGNISETIRLLLQELACRRKLAVAMFITISLAATIVGLNWPSRYVSYTTVYVETDTLLKNLISGNNGQNRPEDDRAELAREALLGRRILTQVAQAGGWSPNRLEPLDLERLFSKLRARTDVTTVGDKLIKIEYADTDAKRAQKVTAAFAQSFINESSRANSKESREAFAFISGQVAKYNAKLKNLEAKIKSFREKNDGAQPGALEDATKQVTDLESETRDLTQQIAELEVRKKSLQQQLSGQSDAGSVLATVSQQYQTELSELRQKLADLRVTYRDSYPDIITVKDKIAKLESQLAKIRQGNVDGDPGELARQVISTSPLYEQLRSALYEADTNLPSMRSRLQQTQSQLKSARQRLKSVQSTSAQMTELTRSYDVTKELYQDFLHRKETARVSMNLDQGGQGSGLRIDEPAFLPYEPSGPRLLYFILGGFLLGVMAPVAFIFALQQIDPRLRFGSVLGEQTGLAVLEPIPHYGTEQEETVEVRGWALSVVSAAGAVGIIGLLAYLRLQGAI